MLCQNLEPGRFQTNDRVFRKQLKSVMVSVRKPSGIVGTSALRVIGDPPAILYSERIKAGYAESTEAAEAKKKNTTQAYLTKQRQSRQEMCGLHTLGNNESLAEVTRMLMHGQRKEIGNMSLVEYAPSTGGVYIWITKRDLATKVHQESVRFITDGQKHIDTYNHNAILMKNPQQAVFEQNICPHTERFNYGFQPI